jgi:hypothetical protein
MPGDRQSRKLYASEGIVQLKVIKGGSSYMAEKTIEIFTAHG